MNTNIRAIKELLELDFLIPSYQRGYRWDKQQIEDLLEDIWEFTNAGRKEKGEFYCLQPVIVKKQNSQYLLIDGQQRLTTIYILLSYLDDVGIMLYGQNQKYYIEYSTRKNSKDFLENIKNTIQEEDTNIDYYYMSKAFLTIKEWFEENPTRKVNFFNSLTNFELEDKKDTSNNVRVIWYEIGESESEIEVFTRINSGKISLTNAELIKALFLNSKNFIENEKDIKQIEISKEWDEMEYDLQDNEFWYFLTKDKSYSTRIELIFEIFANTELKDRYSTYRYFAKKNNIVELWSDENESIKKVFLSLKYWFDNRKLYHLIGFLISEDIETAQSLYQKFKDKTKSEFRIHLYEIVKKHISLDEIDILEYGKTDNKRIKRILLLFNIATILNNKDSYIRFSFDRFNNESWGLEHIHAQQEKVLSDTTKQKEWLKTTKIYISDCMETNKSNRERLLKRIDKALKSDKIDEFDNLQDDIFNTFGMSEIHTIDNLALLSNKNNSALNNNIFPKKRDIIIHKDKAGEFIPICTKNVFLKYYSKDISKLYFWKDNDRKEYLLEMKSVIKSFLGGIND